MRRGRLGGLGGIRKPLRGGFGGVKKAPLRIQKKIETTPRALRKLKIRNIDDKQVTNEDLKVSNIIHIFLTKFPIQSQNKY